jgi:hypothetical protein
MNKVRPKAEKVAWAMYESGERCGPIARRHADAIASVDVFPGFSDSSAREGNFY